LELIARWQTVRALPAGPERARAMEEVRAAGFFPAPRVFLGRERDGAATLRLCDAQGRVRLRLGVDAEGPPGVEVLDEEGRVAARFPAADATARTTHA
jgi:hypothetical protein